MFAVVKMEDILDELILNWDHTPINIVPGSSWTMAQKGAKRIEMIALYDKCQITAVVCGTLSREFLPLQLIYTDKTTACLPKVQFLEDWLLSYTHNHWSNGVCFIPLKFNSTRYLHATLSEVMGISSWSCNLAANDDCFPKNM